MTLNPIQARSLKHLPGIAHGFFTREGGVSSGIYQSLNCGAGSRDDRGLVLENRRRVAEFLGTTGDHLITAFQTHSADAIRASKPWTTGDVPKVDAIVTTEPGLAIGALAADCAPVLFADPQAWVIAAAHAGWKGALDGILEATVAAMESAGARRERIHAALGPCIGPDAYEVGPEFEERFVAASASNRSFFRRTSPGARPRFDLPGYVLDRLRRLGVAEIESATRCTYANEDLLFSYRRATHRSETDYGRQISAIVLR